MEKQKWISIVLSVAFMCFALLFFSCTELLSVKGASLVVKLPSGRFITSSDGVAISEYIVGIQDEKGLIQEKNGTPNETITFDSLAPGKYLVYARAYEKENCVAYAQQETEIKARETSSVLLNLTWNLLNTEAVRNEEVEFIVTPPKKTTYTIGEVFDSTGIKVEAVFKNGYRMEIPKKITTDDGLTSQPIYYELNSTLGDGNKVNANTTVSVKVTLNSTDATVSATTFDPIPVPLSKNVPTPVITSGPSDVTVPTATEEGSTQAPSTSLSVTVNALEEDFYSTSYQWYQVTDTGDVSLLDSTSTTGATLGNPLYSGATESNLSITFASADVGTYKYYCVVTNSVSDTNNSNIDKATATVKSRTATVTAVNDTEYTVNFYHNLGNGSNDSTSLNAVANSTITVPDAPTRPGYRFTGWEKDDSTAGETTETVQPGAMLTVTEDVQYSAVWEIEATQSNPLVNWSDLVYAVEETELSNIYISGEMIAISGIVPTRAVTIIAADKVKITRDTIMYTAVFTPEEGLFCIKGTETASVVLEGNKVSSEAAFISTTGSNITLEYVTMQNCVNDGTTDGGAIYFYSTEDAYTLNLRNCNFNNNKVTGSVCSGGAVAIDGKKITSNIENCTFTENSAEAHHGGAIYIYGTTLENAPYTHTLKDCTFTGNTASNYGGAMYLYQGTYILDGLTMNNNTYPSSSSSSETGDTNIASDIFAYSAAYLYITLKNINTIAAFNIDFMIEDTPEIKLDDTFNTETEIGFVCTPRTGASVDEDDIIITLGEGKTLSREELACFTVTDTDGLTHTLNDDGTLTVSSN